MARIGFILLLLVFIIPCILARTEAYDKYAYIIILAQYFLAILAVALLMIGIEA